MVKDYSEKIIYHERFYNKVESSFKKAVGDAFNKAYNKLDSSLFENLSVHFASNFDYLNTNSYTKKTIEKFEGAEYLAGCVHPMNPNEIYLQEEPFNVGHFIFKSPYVGSEKVMANSAIHELGHVFDVFYTEKDCTAKEKYKIVCDRVDLQGKEMTEEEKAIEAEYLNNDSYSDLPEFKEALLEDFNKIRTNMPIEKFPYFLGDFYGDWNNDGKAFDKPDLEVIEKAYVGRSEVFAQLFSYAMGTDDGDKKVFTSIFKNTYDLVLKLIKQHSKIEN